MNNRAESAAALLFREVLVRGFLSGRAASAILWAKSGLSSLLDPAERLLADAGASIIFGATVDSIHAGDRGVRVVLRGGGEFVSRRVVSALPVFMLREAIRHEPLARALVEDLDRFRPSPIVSIYLWYDRPLALAPMTGMIGTMTQWLFDRRALHGEEGKNGFISAVISAADDAAMTDPDALATRCAHELERALPELGGARVVRAKVIKERAATFLASPDVEPLRPDTESPIPGLFLAGDWTNTGLPASIEGAVLSGTRAGDVVLRQR
jgi:predicted NAD/FAD-dependent oxidoreductase